MTDTETNLPVKLISELVTDPDFPNSAVGAKVDIQGYTGVIVEVVKNSIKVRSADGHTLSYNFHTLRKLYGPRTEPEAVPTEPEPDTSTAPQAQARPDIILEPNFDAPLVPIETLVHRPDFPKCAFGVLVDLHGYTGVVVELVGHSLKIRSRDGALRRYNAEGLRKIYNKLSPGSSTLAQ
jgi:ribosomal protein L21E